MEDECNKEEINECKNDISMTENDSKEEKKSKQKKKTNKSMDLTLSGQNQHLKI